MEMLIQVASAFVGSFGFAMLFRVKKDKLFWGRWAEPCPGSFIWQQPGM